MTTHAHISPKNLVIISQVFYPDSQATSQLLSALAQEFVKFPDLQDNGLNPHYAKKFFSVKVLSCHPSEARGKSSKTKRALGKRQHS